MNVPELQQMMDRYVLGTATPQEQRFLETYYALAEKRPGALDHLDRGVLEMHQEQSRQVLTRLIADEIKQGERPATRPIQARMGVWARYAAILLLITGATIFWFVLNTPQTQRLSGVAPKQDSVQTIPPGSNRAVLSLSDGRTIVLDSAANGTLANEAGTQISKQNTGSLLYQPARQPVENRLPVTTAYNTISTPRGGQYQVTLPDGSQVWLNAASSIRFPTAFAKDRQVSITGEVYFEIAADKNKPFTVQANGSEVSVLGTAFNINAYGGVPAVKTSLVQGAVRVGGITLAPGQAYIGGRLVQTNIQQDLAWKNGFFNFNKLDLYTTMGQLSRWYDVDVVYEGTIPPITFWGEIQRSLTLSDVLDILSRSGVHFHLKGRQLTVTQ